MKPVSSSRAEKRYRVVMNSFQPLAGMNYVPKDPPKVWHMPAWNRMGPAQQMRALRAIVNQYDRQPEMAELAGRIIREAGIMPRDYRGQAAAILKWVQNPRNIYYLNERGERLQTPDYTLQRKQGDCDDFAILLATLYSSIRLPFRFVLSGKDRQKNKVRWIEGDPVPLEIPEFSHIYIQVIAHPYDKNGPRYFAEPTLQVPLGWDVIAAQNNALPEMGSTASGAATSGGAAAGALTTTEIGNGNWKMRIMSGVLVGVITTVLSTITTALVMQWLNLKRR